MINLISQNLKRLGGSVKRHVVQEVPKIKEEEVNASSLKKIKIKDILRAIVNLEKETAVTMGHKNVNMLIEMYQKAIEYYSALSDDRFEEYIMRLQKLFANERVLEIMNSPEPEEPKPREVRRPKIKDEPVELRTELLKPKEVKEIPNFQDFGEKWPELEPKINIDEYSEKWPSEDEIKDKRVEGINELLQELENEINENEEDGEEYDENLVNRILEQEEVDTVETNEEMHVEAQQGLLENEKESKVNQESEEMTVKNEEIVEKSEDHKEESGQIEETKEESELTVETHKASEPNAETQEVSETIVEIKQESELSEETKEEPQEVSIPATALEESQTNLEEVKDESTDFLSKNRQDPHENPEAHDELPK